MAGRYLKPKRTAVSVITIIAIAGVLLGVMIMILVISVMTGFEREIKEKVLGFEPHIVVAGRAPVAGKSRMGADDSMRNWWKLKDEIRKVQGVTSTAPYVQGQVIAEGHGRRRAPVMRAVEADGETPVRRQMIAGEFDLHGDNVLVGDALARNLRVWVGETLTVYATANIDHFLDELEAYENLPEEEKSKDKFETLKELIIPQELEVKGIFRSGRYDYDSNYFYVPLHIGQELYGLTETDAVHGIAVTTEDAYRAGEFTERVEDHLGLRFKPEHALDALRDGMAAIGAGDLEVLQDAYARVYRMAYPELNAMSWMEINETTFGAIRSERIIMYFLFFFVIIVAGFGIMSTMITVTVEKTREIGVMKALGARRSQIMGVFLTQGVIVGLLGTLSGLGTGMLLLRFRNDVVAFFGKLGWEVFPEEIYGISKLPAKIVPLDLAIICSGAFLTCSLASLIPAYLAARRDAAQALRVE